MKKMFLMAALLVATLSASAQSRFEPGTLTIMPRMGGTGSLFTNAPKFPVGNGLGSDLDSKPTGGFFIGADFEYQMSDRFSLSAGANFSQAGCGWDDLDIKQGSETLKVRDLKIESSYINVPLTLNCYLFTGFAIRTGVQFGFLTDAKAKVKVEGKSGSANYSTELDESIKDEFEKLDISIPVGVSYEFGIPLVLDLRWNFGVTKVNKEAEPGYKDVRNMQAVLSLGYKFAL